MTLGEIDPEHSAISDTIERYSTWRTSAAPNEKVNEFLNRQSRRRRFIVYLINGRRHPEHFPRRVDQDVAFVADLVVAIGAATRREQKEGSNYLRARTFNSRKRCRIAKEICRAATGSNAPSCPPA